MNFYANNEKGRNKIKLYDYIRSKYILIQIFDNLHKRKILNIIKFNKNIKNRIDVNVKDYKECSEKYSSIEIEIIPINNKYGQFINIKEEDKKYYHIYFNDNKEEIKRNYFDENDKVSKIKIIIDYQVKSFNELFYWCKYIEIIRFKKFYRINIIEMRDMFYNCESLKELDLNNFNTINVFDMAGMFQGCSSLKQLNLSNFNTSKVRNMKFMFYGCSSLKELNLSKFNTSEVTQMSMMFYGCSSLKELNLSNFNTNNVFEMGFMFAKCSSLKELNLNNFNTDEVFNMKYMFSDCSSELCSKIRFRYKNIKGDAFYGANKNDHSNILSIICLIVILSIFIKKIIK